MKIVHLSSSFFPASTGGKEVFVYNLIRFMPEATHIVLIHQPAGKENYMYDGIEVIVLPAAVTSNARRSYFSWTYEAVPGFEEVLKTYQPDLVHFHDQGEGASLTHLRICKAAGIKTLLTYHSPGQSCLQRALLYAGKTPCDGYIDITRCTSCRYKVMGMPNWISAISSQILLPIDATGKFLQRQSTRLYRDSWVEFYDRVDMIQIHAYWVKGLLLLNGVAEEKIRYIDMGGHATSPVTIPPVHINRPLKLVFVGRCTDIKGVHLLIEAIQLLPADAALEIYFFGPYWSDTDYGRKLSEKIANDHRFKTPVLLKQDRVIAELQSMDVCIIPSLWPETGPFTVFDAFAAQLPVIGSRYAGIAERVIDNVNGLLFEWNNSADLSLKIKRLLEEEELLLKLKNNIGVNRTFRQMSLDVFQLYQHVIELSE